MKNKLLSFDDLKNAGIDKALYVIGNNGNKYEAYYVQRFEMVFFCMPSTVEIVGYIER